MGSEGAAEPIDDGLSFFGLRYPKKYLLGEGSQYKIYVESVCEDRKEGKKDASVCNNDLQKKSDEISENDNSIRDKCFFTTSTTTVNSVCILYSCCCSQMTYARHDSDLTI